MSKFFDHPIVPLPEMKVREWPCSFDSKYLKSIEICAEQTETELMNDYDGRMARWVKQGRRGMQPQLYNLRGASSRNLYYLCLAADFPVIPKLHHDNPGWTFQAEEVYGMDWDNLPADSLYSQHLDEIIESSTKIKELGEVFKEMNKRSDKALANGGRKDKMILTTAHPVALFLLDQAIKRKHPQYRVVKVTAPMGQAKCTEIFNGFCDKESKSQEEYKDYDILLTTTSCWHRTQHDRSKRICYVGSSLDAERPETGLCSHASSRPVARDLPHSHVQHREPGRAPNLRAPAEAPEYRRYGLDGHHR